jgi:hypothetical protein
MSAASPPPSDLSDTHPLTSVVGDGPVKSPLKSAAAALVARRAFFRLPSNRAIELGKQVQV